MVPPARSFDRGLMITLHIEHPVSDFDTWRAAFGRFAEARERGGVRRHAVRRPVDDPAYVVVDLGFDDEAAARSFEQFLRTTVWARPENSPALRGEPVTRLLRDEPS